MTTTFSLNNNEIETLAEGVLMVADTLSDAGDYEGAVAKLRFASAFLSIAPTSKSLTKLAGRVTRALARAETSLAEQDEDEAAELAMAA